MKRVRHSPWRAITVLALLLVTQLSFATQICLRTGIGVTSTKVMSAGLTVTHAAADNVSDAACLSGSVPKQAPCVVPPYELGLAFSPVTASFNLPLHRFVLIDASQATRTGFQPAALGIVATFPHRQLRDLYCRYLI